MFAVYNLYPFLDLRFSSHTQAQFSFSTAVKLKNQIPSVFKATWVADFIICVREKTSNNYQFTNNIKHLLILLSVIL